MDGKNVEALSPDIYWVGKRQEDERVHSLEKFKFGSKYHCKLCL